ncbi:MAG TPA: hypothetical protein VMF30_16870 [Pirellulales bacterium]|nr:hypothetical protein [Pirellulales bacterium]
MADSGPIPGLVADFVRQVDEYLSLSIRVSAILREHRPTLQELRDKQAAQSNPALVEFAGVELDKRRTRRELLQTGRRLCLELERNGRDSRGVLMLLHHCEADSGFANAAEHWPEVKIELQQIAIMAEANVLRSSGTEQSDSQPPNAPDCLVTLDQVAPLVGLSKRSLERHVRTGKLPEPSVHGGGGKAHKWYWKQIRPFLCAIATREIPEAFPGSRII